jgi:hypothetical protein
MRRNCLPRHGQPSGPRKLLNFTVAAITHVAHGMPTCTQEEIDARVVVCHGCNYFLASKDDPKVGVCSHKDCGCAINRERKYITKLGWKSQDCPLGKWPKLG